MLSVAEWYDIVEKAGASISSLSTTRVYIIAKNPRGYDIYL